MKERVSMIFIARGQIDVFDGAFVVVDKNGTRTHIPVGSVASLMLEPGTRVSHRAAPLPAGSFAFALRSGWRAGATGGGCAGSPICSSIPRTETPSVTKAMIRISAPHRGQASGTDS
jgi:hypothetical protein